MLQTFQDLLFVFLESWSSCSVTKKVFKFFPSIWLNFIQVKDSISTGDPWLPHHPHLFKALWKTFSCIFFFPLCSFEVWVCLLLASGQFDKQAAFLKDLGAIHLKRNHLRRLWPYHPVSVWDEEDNSHKGRLANADGLSKQPSIWRPPVLFLLLFVPAELSSSSLSSFNSFE